MLLSLSTYDVDVSSVGELHVLSRDAIKVAKDRRKDFLFELNTARNELDWDGPIEGRAQHDSVRRLWNMLCEHLSLEKVKVSVDVMDNDDHVSDRDEERRREKDIGYFLDKKIWLDDDEMAEERLYSTDSVLEDPRSDSKWPLRLRAKELGRFTVALRAKYLFHLIYISMVEDILSSDDVSYISDKCKDVWRREQNEFFGPDR